MIIGVNKMSGIPLITEKCAGSFVASAIGDALGWPNEFNARNITKKNQLLSDFIEWQRRSGGQYWNHTEKILAGEYSDDTQMNLAVARSILSGKPWMDHLTSVELPFWLEYERGGGGAMKRAAKSWEKKIKPWKGKDAKDYFNAGGNGAAMRILPHVISGIRYSNYENIANEVVLDATLTHGHPRAIIGALCYSYALYYLFTKKSILSFGELVSAVIDAKVEWGRFPVNIEDEWLYIANSNFAYKNLWNDTVEATLHALEIVLTSLKKGALDSESETLAALCCFDKNINGAGDIAANAAIYLASKYANNPTLGIKSAANAIGSDTDTIASMTGGLLGAICGLDWIPAEWNIIQDYDCLIKISDFLFLENGIEATKEFAANNKQKSDEAWERCPIGQYKQISSYNLPSGKTGAIQISKYITLLGQTIYIKKYTREKIFEPISTFTPEIPKRESSFVIKSSLVGAIKKDSELSNISLLIILNILELYSQETTDFDIIAKKTQINISVVQKIISFFVPN